MGLAILRFGELWLKSEGVKKKFLMKLVSNIKLLLDADNIEHKLKLARTCVFVEVSDEKKAAKIFSRIFGLTSFSFVKKVETDKKKIIDEAILIASKFKKTDTFAIRVRREGKHEFTSQSFAAEIGSAVVLKYSNKVDLTKPKKTIYVEVLSDTSYVFDEKSPSAGGLPMGVEGRSVAYIDDEKKSIVALYMIMKRGCKIIPVVKTGIDVSKIKKILVKYDPKIKFEYIVEADDLYGTISVIAKDTYSKAVVLGECFSDIKFDDKKVELPVFRPLIGLDDDEIDALFSKVN